MTIVFIHKFGLKYVNELWLWLAELSDYPDANLKSFSVPEHSFEKIPSIYLFIMIISKYICLLFLGLEIRSISFWLGVTIVNNNNKKKRAKSNMSLVDYQSGCWPRWMCSFRLLNAIKSKNPHHNKSILNILLLVGFSANYLSNQLVPYNNRQCDITIVRISYLWMIPLSN